MRDHPLDVRRAFMPKTNADWKLGQWNRFEITMVGDRVTVVLNGKTVIDNAELEPAGPTRVASLAEELLRGGAAVRYERLPDGEIWQAEPYKQLLPHESIRAVVDAKLYGFGALYRLYAAREGWVFLAVPDDSSWEALCQHASWEDLGADGRFATAEARALNSSAAARLRSSRTPCGSFLPASSLCRRSAQVMAAIALLR